MALKRILLELRDLLSYAAIGFLAVSASQQFASPFYLDLKPRP